MSRGTPPLPPWADPARAHRNNFDFIRLVLAVLVVYSHSFPMVDPGKYQEPLSKVLPGYTFGGLAVDGFFLISGYLITQSWISRPEFWGFMAKRVRRLYPGFVAMMLVLGAVMVPVVWEGPYGMLRGNRSPTSAPIRQDGTPEKAKPMWRGVRVQEWVGTTVTLGPYIRTDCLSIVPQVNILNGSTWTIRFEFACYIMLGLGMVIGLLRFKWLALGVWIGGLALWMKLAEINWTGREFNLQALRVLLIDRLQLPIRWDGKLDLLTAQLGYIGGIRFAVIFLAGSVFYQFRRWIPHRWWIALPCLAAWVWVSRNWVHAGSTYLSAAVFLPYVFFWLAFVPVRGLDRFARYGDFSYGTYLYAWPIQQMVRLWVGGATPLVNFAISAPLAVAMGAASWHAVEKHFLKRRHQPKGDAQGQVGTTQPGEGFPDTRTKAGS